jgi:2-keto-4-pentenoate hydratase
MTIMDANAQRDLARLLATLRREGHQQSGLEARLVPADKDTAYRIARMVEEELGWQVVGWKIAAAKEEMQKQLRTDSPIYGRVFAPGLKASPASVEHARQLSPIPEVEYMARLGADLPPRAKAYTVEEVTEAVSSLHPGIELAECRFVHDDRFPPLPAILADGAGGGTVCYGSAIADWKNSDIAGQEVTLSCNGVVRRKGTAAAALDHPMVPLTWLANELSRTGIGMKAGQMISTGTLTGMLRPKAGETYVADFGPFGKVTATYS